MRHKEDADHECASRAFVRSRNENVSFGQALEEALSEIEPEVEAGRFGPVRVLENGFVSDVARGLGISKDEARVLLGFMAYKDVHEDVFDSNGDAVVEDAVALGKPRLDAVRFYEQLAPGGTRGEGAGVFGQASRVPPPGRTEDDVKEPGVSKKAEDMAVLASLYAARSANREPEVKEFRRTVLGGNLLPSGATEGAAGGSGALSSPAANEQAQKVSKGLAESYGWDEEDAERFLVTGEPPRFTALTADAIKRGSAGEAPVEIRMTVLPGTPAWYVASVYRWIQHNVLEEKDSRPLGEKGIELYALVVEEETRAAAEGSKLTHREVMDEWNRRHEDHPDYVYVDPRRFGRAVRRAEEVARRHSGKGYTKEPAPKQG